MKVEIPTKFCSTVKTAARTHRELGRVVLDLSERTDRQTVMLIAMLRAPPGGGTVKLAFHGADTDTDTDTDILADFRASIVARMSACPATSLFSLSQE